MTVMMIVVSLFSVWLWVINVRPDKNFWGSALLAFLWAIYFLEPLLLARLIVGVDRVRMISAHRDPTVPRDQIALIRAFRWNVVFYDHDRNPVLKTRADLSRGQLLLLAGELGVPVYDYRAWWGLRELRRGVRLDA